MYTVLNYGRMIADKIRTGAFAEALKKAVRQDSCVLDIGTGTGIFALLACRFGARKVYAIEPDDVIQVAKEIATANGFADRIEFFQKLSTRVQLTEKADVMISDLGGLLPWFQNHIPSIVDARQRLLKPQGILIPKSDSVWVAVVEDPETYDYLTAGWNRYQDGLNMDPARNSVLNSYQKVQVKKEQLVVEAKCWATLDYGTIEKTDASAEITWEVKDSRIAHGIAVWFDRCVAEGIEISNAPGASAEVSAAIYGMLFFPWLKPVSVSAGDTISISLKTVLVNGNYIWSWKTKVLEQGDTKRPKANFSQSTFHSFPLTPENLRKRASDHVPVRNIQAEIDLCFLQKMNGSATLDKIAEELLAQFPGEFATEQEALARVNDLSLKYSE